jgi:hypothetical protein
VKKNPNTVLRGGRGGPKMARVEPLDWFRGAVIPIIIRGKPMLANFRPFAFGRLIGLK